MSAKSQQPFRVSPDATDVELLAKYFRGFGHPTRLRILALVAEQERSVGELVEALDQPQPKVSNHLACLRWCGFVVAERRGKQVFYRVSDPGVTRNEMRLRETNPSPASPRVATPAAAPVDSPGVNLAPAAQRLADVGARLAAVRRTGLGQLGPSGPRIVGNHRRGRPANARPRAVTGSSGSGPCPGHCVNTQNRCSCRCRAVRLQLGLGTLEWPWRARRVVRRCQARLASELTPLRGAVIQPWERHAPPGRMPLGAASDATLT